MNMALLLRLLVAHFLADFPFQPDTWAVLLAFIVMTGPSSVLISRFTKRWGIP